MQVRIPLSGREPVLAQSRGGPGGTKRPFDWVNEIEYNKRRNPRKKHKRLDNIGGDNEFADVTPNPQTNQQSETMSNSFSPGTDKATEGPIL